jgi:MoaA/NifB/PqqE/SkfB family radical SAM enzyme
MNDSRLILLAQLPIPPSAPTAIDGNVPLAAACLKLFARRQGVEKSCSIALLPAAAANSLGDRGLIEAILARRPWIVGFTCYVWNVERTLWIAQRLKQRRPELIVLLGGPEITADNAWVIENRAVDYAVLGEGEQTFARLLGELAADGNVRPSGVLTAGEGNAFEIDAISSPYIEGILDLADDRRMMLETARGCRFHCKYCYYPKSHEGLRFLSAEQILANLNYAVEHGATEVVLLDPTLNQRPEFAEFLRLLRRGNPGGRLAFSGELRAETIDAELARLMREANFHEVEIGLQSVEPRAWQLMGRAVDLPAFERGVKALLAEGIKARVDLILGLPGDTVDSVRRGIDFLLRTRAYAETQVFNLSILPGTPFRREAERLGLRYQPWPPYYVLQTPTLTVEDMFALMEEAQEAFGVEFDALPPPRLDSLDPQSVCHIDLDIEEGHGGRTAETYDIRARRSVVFPPSPSLAFTLWFRSADFHAQRREAAQWIERLLAENPHTTLQVVLEPSGDPERLTAETLELLLAACYRTTTYLDRYYSLQPGRLLGSKRLVVVLPKQSQFRPSESWRSRVAEYATLLS